MKKLLFSTLLTVFVFCGLAQADYPARTKVYFTFNVPYTVKAGEIIVPPGNYAIRDLGIAPSAILALSERGKTHPIAIMYTVRIDRRLVSWTDQPRVVFDTEHGTPEIKKIFIPSEDGYEIISAIGDKEYKLRQAAFVTKTETTTVVTTPEPEPEPKAEPVPEPEPEPAPSVEPAQEPEQKVEPEPEPIREPVAPIKERKRVRKD
jgi:hypothetical protein